MKALSLLMALTIMLAGCVSEDVTVGPTPAELEDNSPKATTFPNWQGIDHTNTSRTNGAYANMSYLAYFSAPWCAHCETTIDSYDQVIPAGRITIFSMEAREEYSNMSDWQNRTETNLNRTFDRPFIQHPDLAKSVDVKSIPHAVFINSQGYVFHVEIGKETNLTYIQYMWQTTEVAMFDPVTGWDRSLETP